MTADRLDKILVARGLAPSRSRAGQLISGGSVTIDGVVVKKSSTTVRAEQQVAVTGEDPWVSRAAHKLLGALETFSDIDPRGTRCFDAGASTGGFTQVLLHYGADHVVAADVGHDQLAPSLREHPQVTNIEGINLRYAEAGDLGAPFDLIVADLSFISLQLVIGPLAQQLTERGQMLLMVKPQFEVGRQRLPRTGVVTDPGLRREAVTGVLEAAAEHQLAARAVARSPLAGQDGNAEFFLWLQPVSGVNDRLETADLENVDFG